MSDEAKDVTGLQAALAAARAHVAALTAANAELKKQANELAVIKTSWVIAQKLWEEWSGRPAQVLMKQAETYGIPFTGDGISLPAVARALHDFLSDNAHALSQIRRGKEMNLEQKELELRKLRLQVGEAEGKYVAMEAITPFVADLMTELRGAAEDLEKEFGKDRLRHFYERVAAVIAKWEKRFGGLEGGV